jgi:hypothetical protein
MKNIKKFLKSTTNLIRNVTSELAFGFLSIILLFALVELFISSWKAYNDKIFPKELLVFYLTAVGLLLTLASVSFSYANVCNNDEKKKIVKGGRWFFYGAVLLILSLLLNYHQTYIANKTWLLLLINIIRIFTFTWSIILGIIAALIIQKGFKELIDSIFW